MVVRAEELEKKYAQTSDQTVRLLQSKQVRPPCSHPPPPTACIMLPSDPHLHTS
jgi:hypothetical protein